MDKKYSISEIEIILAEAYDELIKEINDFATNDRQKTPEEIEEIKLSMLVHILPYRMTILKKLRQEPEI